MMRTYALVNQKGGVGKTTTAINLGAYLADRDQKVLLVDLDPQANATACLGINHTNLTQGTYDALIGRVASMDCILHNPRLKLSLMPASPALAGAQIELVDVPNRETLLFNALQTVVDNYDYVIIDCPPSLGLLTVNGLLAARQGVIIPVQCEYLALEGLTQLMGTLKRVRAGLFPELSIRGLLLTMFDSRTNLAHDVAREVHQHFKDQVFQSIIPRSVRLAEAPSHGLPISAYDPLSPGAQAYQALADELLQGDGVANHSLKTETRATMTRKRGLGRGLDALIPAGLEQPSELGGSQEIPIEAIKRNPRQPRTQLGEEDLQNLADSIEKHGVLQPLIVTQPEGRDDYELIAGHRRLEAARRAGLTHVPTVIHQVTEQQQLEWALIENLQRSDLNPLEAAQGYQNLADDFDLSHAQIAERVGKSRTAVTNTLRLLKLGVEARLSLAQGKISEGHARALLALTSGDLQASALTTVIRRGLNVRQTEELVKKLSGSIPVPSPAIATSPEQLDVERRLEEALGTRVHLKMGAKGGRLSIHFYSDEELNALLDRLLGET